MEQTDGQILNIPQYLNQRPSTDHEESDTNHMEKESHTESTTEEPDEGGIGESDYGKTGKLTLAILRHENLIQAGEMVKLCKMCNNLNMLDIFHIFLLELI